MDSISNVTDVKSLITFLHLSGLALGIGGAWILDLFVFKHLKNNPLTEEKFCFITFVSKMVIVGLAMLWISGLLFLSYYYFVTPEYLWNEKVWAKISIVIVLTTNGYFVHTSLLQKIKACTGGTIYSGLSVRDIHIVTSIGAISFLSWLFPIVLGVSKSLNFSVSMTSIAGFYAGCVLLLLMVLNLVLLAAKSKSTGFHQDSIGKIQKESFARFVAQ